MLVNVFFIHLGVSNMMVRNYVLLLGLELGLWFGLTVSVG